MNEDLIVVTELGDAAAQLRSKGQEVIRRVNRALHALDQGRLINELGELQQSATQFDAACARFATIARLRDRLRSKECGTCKPS